ncbi:amidase signature enzyme [Thelephora terrestris]|uniref:amidase n=1 Tax=Thelephora terrestris TaxID=56493 RepID=A0A9P6HHF0_9AGAM|nr:amidase signature enzyme [Thelephora terrestris]
MAYRLVVNAKRTQRDEAINETAAITTRELSEEDQRIVSSSACQIVQAIKNGQWTSTKVVTAYIKSAIRAQDETNCITEVLFADALKIAGELDAHFAATNELKGPLHGVPITFKDLIDIKGYDSSMGFSQWANKPAQADAELVRHIREAGGVPMAKTNVSQGLANFECSNPLWGVTKNPYNAKFIPGGSTGGEGALLAMGGSAIGWGSDVGGSVRIPAHFCGLYCLKPSSGRISISGTVDPSPGFKGITTVLGPMARSVQDVELASRVVFGKSADYSSAPVLYRGVQLAQKLKFGYYFNDGMARITPACRRAVSETVEALRRQGHECIEFELPSPEKASEIYIALTAASGNKDFFKNKGPDPTDPNLELALAYVPGFLHTMVWWYLKRADPVLARVWKVSTEKSAYEYTNWEVKKDAWIHQFHEKVSCPYICKAIYENLGQVWDAQGFDGIICPGMASPALIHNATKYLLALATAALFYNILDCPVGSIPVTRVDPKLDALPEDWLSTRSNVPSSKELDKMLYKGKWAYDADAMGGLPVGIQLVGKRWEDEKVVEMMKVVDDALGERGFGPDGWERWKAAHSG